MPGRRDRVDDVRAGPLDARPALGQNAKRSGIPGRPGRNREYRQWRGRAGRSMIVEGLLTTVSDSGRLNVAPMGPVVEGDFERLTLRPFQPSTTFENLSRTRCGVFHVVDTVEVMARAAIGRLEGAPETDAAEVVTGRVLRDCCRWFELTIDHIDAAEARTRMTTTIRHRGTRRAFFGFNRARHAVIEAAILATRVHLLERDDILAQFRILESAVEKTGGRAERETFALLRRAVDEQND